jgi:hypothetical protein
VIVLPQFILLQLAMLVDKPLSAENSDVPDQ